MESISDGWKHLNQLFKSLYISTSEFPQDCVVLNKITVAEIDYSPQCLDAIVAKFQFTHMTSRFLTYLFM